MFDTEGLDPLARREENPPFFDPTDRPDRLTALVVEGLSERQGVDFFSGLLVRS